MKKYRVFVNEKCYYLSKEIEAEDQDEAGEKYMEMVNAGNVEVNKSEFEEIQVEEIK